MEQEQRKFFFRNRLCLLCRKGVFRQWVEDKSQRKQIDDLWESRDRKLWDDQVRWVYDLGMGGFRAGVKYFEVCITRESHALQLCPYFWGAHSNYIIGDLHQAFVEDFSAVASYLSPSNSCNRRPHFPCYQDFFFPRLRNTHCSFLQRIREHLHACLSSGWGIYSDYLFHLILWLLSLSCSARHLQIKSSE